RKAPPVQGGSKAGTVTVVATSSNDNEVTAEATFGFGGYATKAVGLKADRAEVPVGESITLTASVEPAGAKQAVEWKIDDSSVADLTVNGLQAVLRTKSGGPVKVTCTANDGTGVNPDRTVGARVAATAFFTRCAKTTIDITEPLQLEGVFTPPEARARIQWEMDPKTVVKISTAGLLTPLNAGVVNVTGSL